MTERIEADGKPVPVSLETTVGKATIVVPPVNRWKSSARHALTAKGGGDDYTWAKTTLSAKDFAEWERLDPDVDESLAFFTAWSEKSGISVGESQASPSS